MDVNVGERAFRVCSGPHDDFWGRVNTGTWERQTFEVFERFVQKEMSYLDFGAWIGPTVLYASQLCARAYAVEPDPIAFSELSQNLFLNPEVAAKVTLINACLSTAPGEVNFGNRGQGGDSMSSLLFGQCATRWLVKALTFKDLISEYQISRCGFIKMDIEGGEYLVLRTMQNILCTHKPILFLSLHPMLLGFRYQHLPLPLKLPLLMTLRFVETAKILRALKRYRLMRTESLQKVSPSWVMNASLRGRKFTILLSEHL